RRTIINSIRSKFSLTEDETKELIKLAEEESRNASSYHEFTSLINAAFNIEKKIKIVEHLWEVAFADSELEKHEEHLIRKISNLLYVPHKEFIATKLRVKERILKEKV
ncbi:MAG: TerB family tellurite resistance protein, partial [Thermodesulfovibrionales bacterium]